MTWADELPCASSPIPTAERKAPMCSPITCPTCGKTTWTGCGQHIEQALAGIPDEQRCAGHDDPKLVGLVAGASH